MTLSRTGVTRNANRVLWPLAGASEDPGGAGDGGAGDGGAGDGGAAGDGGDGGDGDDPQSQITSLSSQLAATKAESAQRRRALKPWNDLAKETGLTPEQIRERLSGGGTQGGGGDKGQQQVDEAALRRQIESDLTSKANRRIVRSEVKALASATFADPNDAVRFLDDLDDIELTEDGDLADVKDVQQRLADLLKAKPYLARQQERKTPDYDGGARKTSEKPRTMTELIREAAGAGRARP